MSTDAVVVAAHSIAGLSWGNPGTRARYSHILAPWDPPERAEQLAGAQSSCALAVCAALLIAEVDGRVTRWRRRESCDPLREPRWGHYDSLPYLEHLAIQRGILKRVTGTEPPDLRAGVYWRIGETGANAHVGIVVEDLRSDLTFATVEGGQLDPLNRRPAPQNCTAISYKTHRLVLDRGVWKIGNRRLYYTADAGVLPCTNEETRRGMPPQRVL